MIILETFLLACGICGVLVAADYGVNLWGS